MNGTKNERGQRLRKKRKNSSRIDLCELSHPNREKWEEERVEHDLHKADQNLIERREVRVCSTASRTEALDEVDKAAEYPLTHENLYTYTKSAVLITERWVCEIGRNTFEEKRCRKKMYSE